MNFILRPWHFFLVIFSGWVNREPQQVVEFQRTEMEVWTRNGLITFCLLFVMELKTRRVHFAACTPNPVEAWMKQIGRNLTDAEDGCSESHEGGTNECSPIGLRLHWICVSVERAGLYSQLGRVRPCHGLDPIFAATFKTNESGT